MGNSRSVLKVRRYIDDVEKFKRWLTCNDPGVEYSKLWLNMRETFADENTNRGYSNNNESPYHALRKLILFSSYLRDIVLRIVDLIYRLICGTLSHLLTGSRYKYKKYGFHYSVDLEKKFKVSFSDIYHEYLEYCKNNGEFFSYSGARIFYYFSLIRSEIPRQKASILEIGAGMANFFTIYSRNSFSFQYVIIDIPEIIPNSFKEVASAVNDVEIFLPHQVEEFFNSDAPKKLVWVVPSQIHLFYEMEFDFFCNTESFAEMKPQVSQQYWENVALLLKSGGVAFTVNRAIRIVDESNDYDSLSSPYRSKSSDMILTSRSIDGFRALIPSFKDQPNLVDVWKKK